MPQTQHNEEELNPQGDEQQDMLTRLMAEIDARRRTAQPTGGRNKPTSWDMPRHKDKPEKTTGKPSSWDMPPEVSDASTKMRATSELPPVAGMQSVSELPTDAPAPATPRKEALTSWDTPEEEKPAQSRTPWKKDLRMDGAEKRGGW
ncbi:MAG: hypothetical protein HYV32_03755 [Candidatus Kerfeldbacteria bacterium]|nr:hypothetical protein [Candidatus Kerfeldbacteria bacterium]